MHSAPPTRLESQSYEEVPQPTGCSPAAVHSLMYLVPPLALSVKPVAAGSLYSVNAMPLLFPEPPAAAPCQEG